MRLTTTRIKPEWMKKRRAPRADTKEFGNFGRSNNRIQGISTSMNSIAIQYQWTGIDSIASKFWLVLLQLMHIFSLSDIHVYDFEITESHTVCLGRLWSNAINKYFFII